MTEYSYYITKYDGNEISDEEQFNRYRDRAVKYINYMTSKPGNDAEISDAVCALCDYYHKNDSLMGIKSESADGVSVTYNNESTDKQMYSILKLYLPKRLLYRGI